MEIKPAKMDVITGVTADNYQGGAVPPDGYRFYLSLVKGFLLGPIYVGLEGWRLLTFLAHVRKERVSIGLLPNGDGSTDVIDISGTAVPKMGGRR